MFSENVMTGSFAKFYGELGITQTRMPDLSAACTLAALFEPRGQRCTITKYRGDSSSDENEAWLYIIGNNEADPEGIELEELRDVERFLKQKKVNSHIRINAERKIAVCKIENLNASVFHLIQALVPRLFPKVFEDNPLTETEKTLIKALSKKDGYILYCETLNKLGEKYNFRELQIKKELTGFEINFEKNQIEIIEQKISERQYEIERYYDEISKVLGDIRDLVARKMGLELMSDENNSNALRDLFLSNKVLELESVRDGRVIYFVNGYIKFWDEAQMESNIRNKRSVFYTSGGNEIKSSSEKEKLMRAIFVDKTLKVRTKTGFVLDTNDRIRIVPWREYPDMSSQMPNPHVQGFGCLGGNREEITKYLGEGDYASAITQTIYSASQITEYDSSVMRTLSNQLFSKTDVRFIELPNGEFVTPAGAMNYLNKEKDGE